MAYYYGEIVAVGECFEDIVGKTLCGHAYDIFVHAVGSCSHDASESSCSEFEVLVEGVDKVGLVGIVEHGLYCFACLFIKGW